MDGWEAKGWPVGMAPSTGAVVYYAPGVGGAGSVGHVAVVKAVNPDGTFLEEGYNGNLPRTTTPTTPARCRTARPPPSCTCRRRDDPHAAEDHGRRGGGRAGPRLRRVRPGRPGRADGPGTQRDAHTLVDGLAERRRARPGPECPAAARLLVGRRQRAEREGHGLEGHGPVRPAPGGPAAVDHGPGSDAVPGVPDRGRVHQPGPGAGEQGPLRPGPPGLVRGPHDRQGGLHDRRGGVGRPPPPHSSGAALACPGHRP
ncbi:CHAP domain-containing protein [Sinomonas atrocyanea]